jgi:hypothetical protein
MGGRTLLGRADIDDGALAAVVARSVGVADADTVQVLTCDVEVAAYDIDALTTAGRYWVRGTAQRPGGRSSYAFFVKVVQSWTRTPQFQMVPEHLREIATAGLSWRTEPVVYRSDLGDRLPPGLCLPEVYSVADLDEESAAIWLRAVDVDPTPWSVETFERAAYLLGRLAASPAVRPLSLLGTHDVVQAYANGRVKHQVVPSLHAEELWRHPLVADAFDDQLRTRILDAAGAVPDIAAELGGTPLGTAHGDACPRNLLMEHGHADGFVLIDFGFWCQAPLGFDLSQLLLGEVQLGERAAAELPELDEACLVAYVAGLRDEGCEVPFEVVRRAHALVMLLFWGVAAVPLEILFGAPAPPAAVFRERADAARFVLDLVDATAPTHLDVSATRE